MIAALACSTANAATIAGATVAAPVPVQALRAFDFANSIGMNIHAEQTDGRYANVAQILADLNYLGIHQLRDVAPSPAAGPSNQAYLAAIAALVKAGNRFDLVATPNSGLSATALTAQLDVVAALQPGAVSAVEGPNRINAEPISYNGARYLPASPEHVFLGGVVGYDDLATASNTTALRATGRVGMYSQETAMIAAFARGQTSSIASGMANTGPGEAETGLQPTSLETAWWGTNYKAYWSDRGLQPTEDNTMVYYTTPTWFTDFLAYVDEGKKWGVSSFAPIYSPNCACGVYGSLDSFATDPAYAMLRAAALYGGALAIDAPPAYFFWRGSAYQKFTYQEIQWAQQNNLRSTVIISPYSDGSRFLSDAQTYVGMFVSNNAIPSEWVVENYDPAQPASVIGSELTPNSMANVALWVARNAPVSTARSLIGDDAAQAFQRDLRAAVKADAKLAGVPVYYYTQNVSINLGTYSNLADDANAVLYPVLGQPPGATIVNDFLSFRMPMPYARVIAEAGYPANTTSASVNGVDPLTQAKQTLDLLFDAYAQGVGKTYLYQLRSAYADPQAADTDVEYGVFDINNVATPLGTALHNLSTLLADAGPTAASFHPTTLAYSLSGLPSGAQSMLLQKSNGSLCIVVWAEPTIWNPITHKPVAAAATTATLTLSAPASAIELFAPRISASPTALLNQASTLTFTLSDDLLVINVLR